MKKVLFPLVAMLLLSVSGIAQTTYTKITSASGLEPGANYLIVAHYEDLGVLAMGYQKSNNRAAIVVSENGDAITRAAAGKTVTVTLVSVYSPQSLTPKTQ